MMVLFEHADYPIFYTDTAMQDKPSAYVKSAWEPIMCIDLGKVTTSFQGDGMLGQIRVSTHGYFNSGDTRLLIQDTDIRLSGRNGFGMLCTMINKFATEVSRVNCVKRSHLVRAVGHSHMRIQHGSTIVELDYNTRTDVLIMNHENCNRANVMSQSGLDRAHSYLPRYDCVDELKMQLVNFCSNYISDNDSTVVKISPGHEFKRDSRGPIFIETDGLVCNPHFTSMGVADVCSALFLADKTVWLNHPVGNERESHSITEATAKWFAMRLNHYNEVNVENNVMYDENGDVETSIFGDDLRTNIPEYDESDAFMQFLLGPGQTMDENSIKTDLCLGFIDQRWNTLNGGELDTFQVLMSDDVGELIGSIADAILPDEEE